MSKANPICKSDKIWTIDIWISCFKGSIPHPKISQTPLNCHVITARCKESWEV